MWDSAIQCIAVLDVLVSMATYSMSGDGEMCRPVVTHSEVPYLDIIGGRHPCVNQTFSRGDFIPNDVTINRDKVYITINKNRCMLLLIKIVTINRDGYVLLLIEIGCLLLNVCVAFSRDRNLLLIEIGNVFNKDRNLEIGYVFILMCRY